MLITTEDAFNAIYSSPHHLYLSNDGDFTTSLKYADPMDVELRMANPKQVIGLKFASIVNNTGHIVTYTN